MKLKGILTVLAALVFTGATVAGGTGAFFSDSETSSGNVFTAGALDLKVDSAAHYNGMICYDSDMDGADGSVWHPEELVHYVPGDEDEEGSYELNISENDVLDAFDDFNEANPGHYPQAGDECDGTWELTDLGPTNTFFNLTDLKPGDSGENTISLHVLDNDAYACAIVDNFEDNDLGINEPEAEAGDTTNGLGNGELSPEIHFFAWGDDGDNKWEEGEEELFSNVEGPASDIIDGVVYPLYTPQTSVLHGSTTTYLGLYWCYGEMTVNEGAHTLSCNGSGVTNISQSDQIMADITFYVEQARHNSDFECPILADTGDDDDDTGDDDTEDDDDDNDPELVATSTATTTDMGVKYRSFKHEGADAPDEVLLGALPLNPSDLGQDFQWTVGTNTVSLVYNQGADTLTSTVNGNPPLVLTNVAAAASCPVSQWNTFQAYVKKEAGVGVLVDDLTIESINFGDIIATTAGGYWQVSPLALGDGFTATAKIILTGAFSDNGDGNVIEFSVGCGS